MKTGTAKFDEAYAVFKKHKGIMRRKAALACGVFPRTLYAMRDQGLLIQVSRGLFRLPDMPPLKEPDLAIVGAKVKNGVVCLISALAFHSLTSQIPHEVGIALERGIGEIPRIEFPPLKVYWFTGRAFHEGIETHNIDGIDVRIYSPEKTLADCFKFRNKIGQDVAVEALKLYRERKPLKVDEILRYARICRVEKVMKPYLEAIL